MKDKPMLRFVAVLTATLLILIFASRLSIRLTERAMERYADKETEHKSEYAGMIINMLFQSGEWSVYSFMAGFTDLQAIPDSSAVGGVSYRPVLSEERCRTLTADDLYARIQSYVAYNYDCCAVVAIFEPGVLSHIPQGIAAKVTFDGHRSNLLTEGYAVSESSFYKSVKSSQSLIERSARVGRDSLLVFSSGIPIFSSDGAVIGEFWVDMSADTYSNLLKTNQTADEVTLFFIDQDCRIISAADKENNGCLLCEVAPQAFGCFFTDNWYAQVQACNRLDTLTHFQHEVHGESFVTTLLPIEGTPFKLLLIKSGKTIYTDVNRSSAIASAVMVVCFILVACCLVVIFRVMKRNHDEGDRMQNELDVAASIQQSLLPPNMAADERFDICGFQRSAKMVGGDLYDFVLKGDSIHFCIGDVSGKGVPAAIVTAELSSLYRYVIRHHVTPDEIVSHINKALMERSDDTMFCTLLVGVLDLRSGLLRFCNAGHNPPILVTDGTPRFMKVKPHMPVCAFENYHYTSEQLQLQPGDRLFLYTDGVTEAQDRERRFFGSEATLQTVGRLCHQPSAQMIDGVMEALNHFAGKAEQHDDITMLCIGYKGAGDGTTLHYDGMKNRVTEIVDAVLAACSQENNMKLRLAVEEPVQNIADYAYADDGPLDIYITNLATRVIIVLKDKGIPFNPLQQAAPDFSVPIMQRSVGGLGIYLTRQVMEKVEYQYESPCNILTLTYQKPS